MNTRLQVALVLVAIAIAIAAEVSTGAPMPLAIGDGAAGAAMLATGVVALAGTRGRGAGALMIATGATWLAGTLSAALVFVHRGPLLQLVLAYPRAQPAPWLVGLVIAVGYATALVTSLGRNAEMTLVLAAAVLTGAALRFVSARGAERRARLAALAAGVVVCAALTVGAIGRLEGGSLDDFALWTYDAAVVLTALGLCADLRWGRWERAAVSELVADLGEVARPSALRERLARTLGDPTLEVGFATAAGFVDETGRVINLAPAEGRAVSYADDRVAALSHDPALLQDERLLSIALSAARLATENERMLAAVREGVEQLEASRRRLVEAGIEQRRGLEEDLRTGAELRLQDVAGRLRQFDTDGALDELIASVERARADLRRFAQGIHPVVLTEQGLHAALVESAALMPFQVALDVPDERLPASVEVTVYFLCVEALANIGKHAGASAARIAVHRDSDVVRATVADNGRGGADLMAGTGLRGLADRVAALGGTLLMKSPPGAGTTLDASIPV